MLQVVRGDFIVFFNQIFDALCKLSADSDANVQSAAHLLDRLVKVLTYSPPPATSLKRREGKNSMFQTFSGHHGLRGTPKKLECFENEVDAYIFGYHMASYSNALPDLN